VSDLLKALLNSEIESFPETSSPPSPSSPRMRGDGDVGEDISGKLSQSPPALAAEAANPERNRWPERTRPPLPLRRCSALVCRTCHTLSPSPHREDCAFPRYDVCRSRWYWLSPNGAIKCVACASPADLALVEAWVLACETGEGDDGWRIPNEIWSLLNIKSLPQ
jgi:hypothetical protein